MIGVKFNRAMRPYGAGDTALLPEDVAQTVVDEGAAELYEFPSSPHSSAPLAPGVSAPTVSVRPALGSPAAAARPIKQTYRTKGR